VGETLAIMTVPLDHVFDGDRVSIGITSALGASCGENFKNRRIRLIHHGGIPCGYAIRWCYPCFNENILALHLGGFTSPGLKTAHKQTRNQSEIEHLFHHLPPGRIGYFGVGWPPRKNGLGAILIYVDFDI